MQDRGTRGGAFHGEMDRCRESQGWITACNGTSRYWTRRGKERIAHESVLVLIRSRKLISHKRRQLVSSLVEFVLFCFNFVHFCFL